MKWSFVGVFQGIIIGSGALLTLLIGATGVGCLHYSAAATADDICGDFVIASLPDKTSWERIGAGWHDAVINADHSFTARIPIRSIRNHEKNGKRIFSCTVRSAPYGSPNKSGWDLLNITELAK